MRNGIHNHPAGASYFSEPDPDAVPDVTLLSERTVKTSRKPHHCDRCEGVIPSGSPYSRTVLIYDGEFQVWKSHALTCSP